MITGGRTINTRGGDSCGGDKDTQDIPGRFLKLKCHSYGLGGCGLLLSFCLWQLPMATVWCCFWSFSWTEAKLRART